MELHGLRIRIGLNSVELRESCFFLEHYPQFTAVDKNSLFLFPRITIHFQNTQIYSGPSNSSSLNSCRGAFPIEKRSRTFRKFVSVNLSIIFLHSRHRECSRCNRRPCRSRYSNINEIKAIGRSPFKLRIPAKLSYTHCSNRENKLYLSLKRGNSLTMPRTAFVAISNENAGAVKTPLTAER
ncbi:hypothetical protein PUN28_017255 [Cardiocondyla obscurior]|uniref:Uncharacterized protein n=1 Tax=Cardiocondyla obscurior TaxID=286306 RepID=A0AAW2EPQ6_9HYME